MATQTTNDLIESLTRITAIPVSQATFTDEILADFLNDELVSTITPILMDVREEFFVSYADFDISSTGTTLDIPNNTVGEKLREIVIVDTKTNGDEEYTNIPRLSIEQLASTYDLGNNSKSGFIIQGNQVKLYPQSGWDNETIRMYYYRRPGTLTLVANTAKVTAIDTGASTVTVNAVPTGWANNKVVDVIEGRQPYGTPATGRTITNIVAQTLTMDSVDDITVGDYLASEGYAPIAQVPDEAQRLLVQATKIQILESLDDDRNWKIAKEKYHQMLTNFLKSVTERVDGQPKKVVSNNNIFNKTRSYHF